MEQCNVFSNDNIKISHGLLQSSIVCDQNNFITKVWRVKPVQFRWNQSEGSFCCFDLPHLSDDHAVWLTSHPGYCARTLCTMWTLCDGQFCIKLFFFWSFIRFWLIQLIAAIGKRQQSEFESMTSVVAIHLCTIHRFCSKNDLIAKMYKENISGLFVRVSSITSGPGVDSDLYERNKPAAYFLWVQ